jgi:hypothetical protein
VRGFVIDRHRLALGDLVQAHDLIRQAEVNSIGFCAKSTASKKSYDGIPLIKSKQRDILWRRDI